MSRQSLIENYFKSKASTPQKSLKNTMSDVMKVKKRKLTLTKPVAPTKSPKVTQEDKNVIQLSSDEEEVLETTPTVQVIDLSDCNDNDAVSDSSVQTVTYSFSPGTPKRTALTERTPDNSLKTFRMCLKFENSEDEFQSSPEIGQTPVKSEKSDKTVQNTLVSTSGSSINKDMHEPQQKLSKEICTKIIIKAEEKLIKVETVDVQDSLETDVILQNTSSTGGTLEKNLNINRTPIKSDKEFHEEQEATTLIKTEISTPQKTVLKTEQSLESIHLNGTPVKTKRTPENTQEITLTPQKSKETNTPLKTSQNTPQKTPQSHSSTFRSPTSTGKFYSPTKKRAVVKRTSVRVKRSLSMELSGASHENELFSNACEGMDDKTIFLLTIINQYLNNDSIRHLLDTHCQELLTSCLQVTKPGMRLVCRLFWRKVGYYKLEPIKQISFEKVPCDNLKLQEMLKSLVENGLIELGDMHNMTFDDYITILSRLELTQICKELKLKMSTKQDAIEALKSFSKRSSNISHFVIGYTSNNSKRVLQLMSQKAGPCYRLSDLARATLNKLYILMYMGMDYSIIREKRLELTLLYDKIGRETYPVAKDMVLDNASVVFRSRDEFERYLTAYQIHEDLQNKTDLSERCDMVKQVFNLYKDIDENDMTYYQNRPLWLCRYTQAYVYVKIIEGSIQDLKKGEHHLLALEVLSTLIAQTAFRQHRKADWYAEKALILHAVERYDEAAEILLEGFKSDLSEEEKDAMRPRARKIATQKNIVITDHLKRELLECATKDNILEKNLGGEHINKQPMDRTNKRGKVKFETKTEGGRMVQDAEEFCITHYICTGQYTHGEHWEGRIVSTIFYLLFWDIIYSKPTAPGIFLSHYQVYPLDMFCGDSFYTNRRKVIDDWLDALERFSEAKILGVMHDTWNNRPEGELSGITRSIGWEKIKMVASCLGARAVAAICRRLAANYRYTHSGFPDLTLWNINTKRIKFVEVKTDTDKPSMKQIQWMNYLREHGVDTELCYLGANTTRQRCRNAKPEPVTTETSQKQKSVKLTEK